MSLLKILWLYTGLTMIFLRWQDHLITDPQCILALQTILEFTSQSATYN